MVALQVNVLARDAEGNIVSDTVTVDVADAVAPPLGAEDGGSAVPVPPANG
jgi:hypothetical protein